MTTTAPRTNKQVLTEAPPAEIADALRHADLGNMFTPIEVDSGTISAVAAVPLTGTVVGSSPTRTVAADAALAVLSAHVVTSDTAASVGHYLCSDSAATPLLPPGGANTAVGIASVQRNADGSIKTVTFPNTVTRVVFQYLPAPAKRLDANFLNTPSQ